MIRAVLIILLALSGALPAAAQSFGALARVVAEETRIETDATGIELTLGLSQPVPFRVFTLADPWRVVMDFREVSFDQIDSVLPPTGPLVQVEAGQSPDAGWSRMILSLDAPFLPETAAMRTDPETGRAAVTLGLAPVEGAVFRASAGPPPAAALPPEPVVAAATDAAADGPLVVVLDPGHGRVDPGAVRGDHTEAALVLTFARELRDALRRTGRVEVLLTRDADIFVPLPTRVTVARAAEADLFLSIHADALAEGRAQGATVYTLAERATDAAAAALAEQHDRADLLQGVDLHGSDDVVAGVLMDLARMETAPRGRALADGLVAGIAAADLTLHSRPRGEAGFTVLRAADIPSALLEIGFMSDRRDLENILDPEWRAQMQAALVAAILDWAEADAARTALLRQ